MTEIKVGDRVEATNQNGDTSVFTVVEVDYIDFEGALRSSHNVFYPEYGWTFKRLPKPLPTKYGLYQPNFPEVSAKDRVEHNVTYRFTETDGWVDSLHNKPAEDRARQDNEMFGLVRLVWED